MTLDPLLAVGIGALIAWAIGDRMTRAAQREKDQKEDRVLQMRIRMAQEHHEWERRFHDKMRRIERGESPEP